MNPDLPSCPVTSVKVGPDLIRLHPLPREPSARSSSRRRLRRGIACLLLSRSRAAQSTVPSYRQKKGYRRQDDGSWMPFPRLASPTPEPVPLPLSLPVTSPRGGWADFAATARFSAAVPCHPGAFLTKGKPSSPTRVSFSWRAPRGAIGLHPRVFVLHSARVQMYTVYPRLRHSSPLGLLPCPAPGAQTTSWSDSGLLDPLVPRTAARHPRRTRATYHILPCLLTFCFSARRLLIAK